LKLVRSHRSHRRGPFSDRSCVLSPVPPRATGAGLSSGGVRASATPFPSPPRSAIMEAARER
jgi:hypothetical protein